MTIDVQDTTAPALSFALLTTELWPPNHTMHTVATISASDVCDASAAVAITITATATDDAGTASSSSGQVKVPHSKKK